MKRVRIDVTFDLEEFRQSNPFGNQPFSDNTCILGIDEAGRGSILGPMIYCGSIIALKDYPQLIETGAAYSKTLNEKNRQIIATQLNKIDSFVSFIKKINADVISEAMLSPFGENLNTLSHHAAIDIISLASQYCKGKLAAVFVDTVGLPEIYERKLRGHFPQLRITVTSKADAKFPIVNAASIMAKTERDASIEPVNVMDAHVGNGYPSDPIACAYIKSSLHRFFGFRTYKEGVVVRQSWKPVQAVVEENCVAMKFESDQTTEEKEQMALSFSAPEPKRDVVFEHVLQLKNISFMTLGGKDCQ